MATLSPTSPHQRPLLPTTRHSLHPSQHDLLPHHPRSLTPHRASPSLATIAPTARSLAAAYFPDGPLLLSYCLLLLHSYSPLHATEPGAGASARPAAARCRCCRHGGPIDGDKSVIARAPANFACCQVDHFWGCVSLPQPYLLSSHCCNDTHSDALRRQSTTHAAAAVLAEAVCPWVGCAAVCLCLLGGKRGSTQFNARARPRRARHAAPHSGTHCVCHAVHWPGHTQGSTGTVAVTH